MKWPYLGPWEALPGAQIPPKTRYLGSKYRPYLDPKYLVLGDNWTQIWPKMAYL